MKSQQCESLWSLGSPHLLILGFGVVQSGGRLFNSPKAETRIYDYGDILGGTVTTRFSTETLPNAAMTSCRTVSRSASVPGETSQNEPIGPLVYIVPN